MLQRDTLVSETALRQVVGLHSLANSISDGLSLEVNDRRNEIAVTELL